MLDVTAPQIMGILNVTPDSFSDGGQYNELDAGKRHLDDMISAGADIIDIGGESTRPGAKPVSVQAELDRVLPFVEYAAQANILIAVDTSHPKIMQAVIEQGAHIINDVRALTREGALEVVAKANVPVCIMHMQNIPDDMQDEPVYDDVVQEVYQFLESRIEACLAAGIARDNIIVDPGFGFGKTLSHNATLLLQLADFQRLDCPLLVGLSRKALIGHALALPVNARLMPSVALNVMAYERGARIFRVHDVLATRRAIDMVHAIHQAE